MAKPFAAEATSELFEQRRWTAVEARRVLEAWPNSKLSLAAFARERNLDPRRLYWWRARLLQPAAAISFEEISLPRAGGERRVALEVVLRSGLVVRVDNSFDAVALQRLICVLEKVPA
jgi:hypothetical protein